MNGTATNVFSPDLTITRGMISTILYRLSGSTDQGQSAFTDVVSSEYYGNAIYWAEKNGIIKGYGNGLFGPNDNITHEQLITILYRYAGSPKVSTDNLKAFGDATDISAYATDAYAWAYQSGVITKNETATLKPQDRATRAEAAEMLYGYQVFLNSAQ